MQKGSSNCTEMFDFFAVYLNEIAPYHPMASIEQTDTWH
jgi:hypothetical protein